MPLLTVALIPGPDQVIVRLSGEADLSTVDLVAGGLRRAAGLPGRRVVVDLAQATFWDCSGLHVLAEVTAELARAGRECRVVGATRTTRRLIDLADFAPLLALDGPLCDPGVGGAAEERPVPMPVPAEAARPAPAVSPARQG